VQAVTRFGAFLGQADVPASGQVDREVLERYLAILAGELAGKRAHRSYIGLVNTFLQAVRRHGCWTAAIGPRPPLALVSWLYLTGMNVTSSHYGKYASNGRCESPQAGRY
jgi:hypothetical protein